MFYLMVHPWKKNELIDRIFARGRTVPASRQTSYPIYNYGNLEWASGPSFEKRTMSYSCNLPPIQGARSTLPRGQIIFFDLLWMQME